MAFGPEYVTGLAGALRKILPLRVSRIEGGDTWTALKTQGEQWLILSWTSGAAGMCTATQSQINALKDISPSKASISEALKSRLTHGGEIFSVRQLNNDRVLELGARRRVSAGLSVNYYLVLEITEPVANFLLLDENHRIDEAAKHSTPDMNRFRTILPGHTYTPPPVFEGLDVQSMRFLRFEDVQNLRGIGRPLARLILQHWDERDAMSWQSALVKLVDEDSEVMCRAITKNGYMTRLDFPMSETVELGTDPLRAAGYGVLRPLLARGREKKLHDIDAKIKRAVKAKERHRDGLTKQLKECREAEIFRQKGEAILAHIYEIPKRAENITLTDWDGQVLKIELDPDLPPSRNAEKYFKRYRKAKGSPAEITANIAVISAAIDELKEQHALLDSIDDPENFTQALKDLDEWISPEQKQKSHSPKARKKQSELPPHLNITKDGVNILVGHSARGNRYVTLKAARPEDIWLHAHELPGAHVIIRGVSRAELEGEKREILEYAAGLAAGHSSGKGAGSVPVDYTEKKYVRSVPGTVALVTYTNPGTLRISPISE
ncbi:MAG: NFACT family protein [Synergistaceae bacterium]|nr:NFACT family protein [Synergistaceae bacterium]